MEIHTTEYPFYQKAKRKCLGNKTSTWQHKGIKFRWSRLTSDLYIQIAPNSAWKLCIPYSSKPEHNQGLPF